MIELVSTSLPDGLLPGTHGFATVAMTRGTPETLRRSLEGLSSYRHRYGEHGPRYRTDNPWTWSHLVLPQGEHVFSCVRACEFDYTGRTNRLARHLCLSAGEMPAELNPAALLRSLGPSLSADWTGSARWLDPAGAPPSPAPRTDRRAASWTALYDGAGVTLAAGFAAELRRQIESRAPRPLLFRTSQTWDPDGQRLLSLFDDLIELLPDALRAKATFSTYPASLPGTMVCHLRGTQPDDPLFAALSTGCPWFDCATGQTGNAHLLPRDEGLEYVAAHGHEYRPAPAPSSRVSINTRTMPASAHSPAPAFATPSPALAPARTRTVPASSPYLPPPKKDYTILILAGAVAIGLVAAAVILLWPASKTGASQSVQPSNADGSDNSHHSSSNCNSTADSSGDQGTEHKNEENSETNAEANPTASTSQKEQPEVGEKDESASRTPQVSTSHQSKPAWAFTAADKVAQSIKAKNFKGGSRFYYDAYHGDLKEQENPVLEAMGQKNWKSLPANPWHVQITYETSTKQIAFEFLSLQSDFHLFAQTDDVDLRFVCFGKDETVFETFCKLNKTWKETYHITVPVKDGSSSFDWTERTLSAEPILDRLRREDVAIAKRNTEQAKEEWDRARKTVEAIKEDLNKAKSYKDNFDKYDTSRTDAKKRREEEKKKTKPDEDAIKRFEKQIDEANNDIDKLSQHKKEFNDYGVLTAFEWKAIVDLVEKKLKDENEKAKALGTQYEIAKKHEREVANNPQIREQLRQATISVTPANWP